jgi:two-component system, cell cycle sensor histidine kinase and response regulator CckA
MEQGMTTTKQDSVTIYVVEDEAALLDLVGLTLASGPWRVKSYATAEDALRDFAAEEIKPELLLTDYELGSSNGLSLAAECRKMHPELKIILMSGTVSSEVVQTSPVELQSFLPKPFRPRQLWELVNSFLADG